MKNIILTFAILVFLSSCLHQQRDIAIVKGSFSDEPGVKLVLQEMDTHEIHVIDSVVLGQSGKFSFNPFIEEPGFWLLKAQSGKILVLLLHAGDKIELTGSARDFPDNVILKGPADAMLLNDFFRHTRQNETQVDSLEMLLAERQDSADYYPLTQKLDTLFRSIWEQQRAFEIAFLTKHPESLASLIILNYAFGLSPVLSPDEDFRYYELLDSALSVRYPDNKHVKFHHQRVLELRQKTQVRK